MSKNTEFSKELKEAAIRFIHLEGNVSTLNGKLNKDYADFGNRFIPFIIDNLIFVVPLILIIIMFVHFTPEIQWATCILFFLLYILYFAYFESSISQATIGKKLFGTYVCDISGNRLSFRRAFVRSFFRSFLVNIPIFGIITAWMIDHSKTKQGLHDLIPNTIVLKGVPK